MTYVINFDNLTVYTSYSNYKSKQNICNCYESRFFEISDCENMTFPKNIDEFVYNGQEKEVSFQYNGNIFIPLY